MIFGYDETCMEEAVCVFDWKCEKCKHMDAKWLAHREEWDLWCTLLNEDMDSMFIAECDAFKEAG